MHNTASTNLSNTQVFIDIRGIDATQLWILVIVNVNNIWNFWCKDYPRRITFQSLNSWNKMSKLIMQLHAERDKIHP